MCARTDLECVCASVGKQKWTPVPPPIHHVHTPETQLPPPDTLAVLTAYHRQLLEQCNAWLNQLLSENPRLSVLVRTTQPAHLLMVAAVLLVSSLLTSSPAASPSNLISLAYLASFSIHIGNQFWMTFISGLSLYFNLPRHNFGAVQKVLFPKYFTVNSLLSLVTLISFTKLRHISAETIPEIIQTVALSSCFLLEMMIRLYVVPSVICLIGVKTNMEQAAGVGEEVGHFSPGPLANCPHYKSIHQEFRRKHTLVAIANIITMSFSVLHLYYIADNLLWACHNT